MMETLIERMSKYTKKLQEAVEERSVEIVKEKMKCDELLSKMLPRYIYIIKSSTDMMCMHCCINMYASLDIDRECVCTVNYMYVATVISCTLCMLCYYIIIYVL